MTRYEKLINGTKAELVSEFVNAMTWARELSNHDWNCILNDCSGLGMYGFVCETLDQEVE